MSEEKLRDLKIMIALEKQTPKKPLFGTLPRDMACHCPVCTNFVCFRDVHKANYCPHCGQKLDWSEENE